MVFFKVLTLKLISKDNLTENIKEITNKYQINVTFSSGYLEPFCSSNLLLLQLF